jgi:hypothetical protein
MLRLEVSSSFAAFRLLISPAATMSSTPQTRSYSGPSKSSPSSFSKPSGVRPWCYSSFAWRAAMPSFCVHLLHSGLPLRERAEHLHLEPVHRALLPVTEREPVANEVYLDVLPAPSIKEISTQQDSRLRALGSPPRVPLSCRSRYCSHRSSLLKRVVDDIWRRCVQIRLDGLEGVTPTFQTNSNPGVCLPTHPRQPALLVTEVQFVHGSAGVRRRRLGPQTGVRVRLQ